MSATPPATLTDEPTEPSSSTEAGDSHLSVDLRPYLWMLAGAIFFAVMGVLTHAAGAQADWRVVALVRAILSFVFAASIAIRAGSRLVFPGPKTLWMRSIAGSISLVCTFYALTHLPPAETLTLTNMFPLWVVLLSGPLLGVIPGISSWVAAGLAVSGVAAMGLSEYTRVGWSWNPAYLVALGASFTSAIAMIGLHRLAWMAPTVIVTHFSGVAVVFCLCSLYLPGTPAIDWHSFGLATVLLLLGVGITATAGQLSITRAFATGSPSKVSVVALTQVVFALLLDQLIWQHPLDVWKGVGMAMILLPTAWVMTHRPDPND